MSGRGKPNNNLCSKHCIRKKLSDIVKTSNEETKCKPGMLFQAGSETVTDLVPLDPSLEEEAKLGGPYTGELT